MYAYKDLLELAGLTTRVYTLISTLHALPPIAPFQTSDKPPVIALDNVGICVPERRVGVLPGGKSGREEREKDGSEHDGSLMEPLKLVINRGEHIMITGPVRSLFLILPSNRTTDKSLFPLDRMASGRLLSPALLRAFGSLWEAFCVDPVVASTKSSSSLSAPTWSSGHFVISESPILPTTYPSIISTPCCALL